MRPSRRTAFSTRIISLVIASLRSTIRVESLGQLIEQLVLVRGFEPDRKIALLSRS